MAMGSWIPLHTSSLGAHGTSHSLALILFSLCGASQVPAPCWLWGTSWVGMAPPVGGGAQKSCRRKT